MIIILYRIDRYSNGDFSECAAFIELWPPVETQNPESKPFCVWHFPTQTNHQIFLLHWLRQVPERSGREEHRGVCLFHLYSCLKAVAVKTFYHHTWRKEHDVPRDTFSVTWPNISCTRPDFRTSIFPMRPSLRSFRLQLLSSFSSSCFSKQIFIYIYITFLYFCI